MKPYKSLLIFAVTLVIIGCQSSEYELQHSVYRPDPDYASLPEYSEWGYNTFGAYYDRKLFIYDDNLIPAKIINTGGTTTFILKGVLDQIDYDNYYDNYSYGSYPEMTLFIELKRFSPQTYEDLVNLNNTVFDLTEPDCHVVAAINSDTIDLEIFSGNLEFKRAQNLVVDNRSIKVILSGIFEFKALVANEPVSFSFGRFDVGIGEPEFYCY